MAGSLSHSGLTGACTAGDLGYEAQVRAPIMINIPFIGHIFVFSVLAASATAGKLLIPYTLLIVAAGLGLTYWAIRLLKKSQQ
jgi:tryptophan-rich sensory protein